jgi:UDP-2,4-diacetamido-2,4,6-trideoxy-beta-L-altropyranose hydrolase
MKKYSNILLRVDSSFDIGTGHIMRDLVLVKKYEPANVIFATLNLKGNVNQKILDAGHHLHLLKSNQIDELVKYVNANDIDLLIIDNYTINYNFEKKLKEETNVEILSFDDMYEEHYCDILLNHNIYADKEKYKGLVPDFCEVRCGIEHTLLRDEFLKVLPIKSYKSKERPNIFVAMGGADSKRMNISILETLKNFAMDFTLVTTHANIHIEELIEYAAKADNISIHIDADNISDIIDSCDFAIVTPSVMVNEIIFLKIPFISLMVTNNQIYMHQFLEKYGITCISKNELELLPVLVKKFYTKENYIKQLEIIDNLIKKRIKT